MSNHPIFPLFQPRSVAVIGVSSDSRKIASRVLQNIVTGGYQGRVFGVNPKGGSLPGVPFIGSLAEAEEPVDVAVIAVPAPRVLDAVHDCCTNGVKYALIVSSGFSEIGNRVEESSIVELARQHGMRVLGPNIFGLYSAATSLNATFGPPTIRRGGVAIVSQSGALGLAMIGKTTQENIGLSAIVSVGNKADLTEVELLEYLIEDPQTEVILLYIEGIRDGSALVEVLSRATRVKPVVAIKSGRSRRGAMAAASHTGSLAGADEVFDGIMGQCGVLRAESIREAFDLCRSFSAAPPGRVDPLVVVTNGGGIGVLAADAAEKYGLTLFDDAEVLDNAFASVTPDFGSTKNPIDLTGGATPRDYEAALDAALTASGAGGVLALYCETAVFDADALATILEAAFRKYRDAGRPIAFSAIGGESTEKTIETLRGSGIPVFSDVYDAVFCLGSIQRVTNYRMTPVSREKGAPKELGAVCEICSAVHNDGRHFLLADEAAAILDVAGIRRPHGGVAATIHEALALANKVGYPVALKVVSPEVIHKSDAGGLALGLDNDAELIEGWDAIYSNVSRRQPGAVIRGLEVTKMAPSALEVIAAARRDPTFGPIVMVGLGGIYVEVLKDVAFGSVPLDRAYVMEMIRNLRTFPLLLGARGEEQKDIEAVVSVILTLAKIIDSCDLISDIEVNPLRVYDDGDGAIALDARILLEPPLGEEERKAAQSAPDHSQSQLPQNELPYETGIETKTN